MLSSRIEGTQATLGEPLAAGAGAVLECSPANLREFSNYVVALDYPIPVPEFAPLKVRYYFGDDFDIRVMRHDGKLSFFLYPKDNPRPASY